MKLTSDEFTKGSVFAILAYLCWGFFPIFWKLVKEIAPIEILFHRIIWAYLFYSIVIFIKHKKFRFFSFISTNQKILLGAASVLLMSNWFLYIYAVNSNQIVESSLGYFINPLVNILLGVFLLNERLSRVQLWAVWITAIGVSIIALADSKIPWIAIALAITFSLYGFIKKKCNVNALESNQFESFIFLLPALFFIFFKGFSWLTLPNASTLMIYLALSGLVTGLPLLFFAGAAKRIPYYQMGFYQFIAPSIQFLSGVILFNEAVTFNKLIGFGCIWSACIFLILNIYLQKNGSLNEFN